MFGGAPKKKGITIVRQKGIPKKAPKVPRIPKAPKDPLKAVAPKAKKRIRAETPEERRANAGSATTEEVVVVLTRGEWQTVITIIDSIWGTLDSTEQAAWPTVKDHFQTFVDGSKTNLYLHINFIRRAISHVLHTSYPISYPISQFPSIDDRIYQRIRTICANAYVKTASSQLLGVSISDFSNFAEFIRKYDGVQYAILIQILSYHICGTISKKCTTIELVRGLYQHIVKNLDHIVFNEDEYTAPLMKILLMMPTAKGPRADAFKGNFTQCNDAFREATIKIPFKKDGTAVTNMKDLFIGIKNAIEDGSNNAHFTQLKKYLTCWICGLDIEEGEDIDCEHVHPIGNIFTLCPGGDPKCLPRFPRMKTLEYMLAHSCCNKVKSAKLFYSATCRDPSRPFEVDTIAIDALWNVLLKTTRKDCQYLQKKWKKENLHKQRRNVMDDHMTDVVAQLNEEYQYGYSVSRTADVNLYNLYIKCLFVLHIINHTDCEAFDPRASVEAASKALQESIEGDRPAAVATATIPQIIMAAESSEKAAEESSGAVPIDDSLGGGGVPQLTTLSPILQKFYDDAVREEKNQNTPDEFEKILPRLNDKYSSIKPRVFKDVTKTYNDRINGNRSKTDITTIISTIPIENRYDPATIRKSLMIKEDSPSNGNIIVNDYATGNKINVFELTSETTLADVLKTINKTYGDIKYHKYKLDGVEEFFDKRTPIKKEKFESFKNLVNKSSIITIWVSGNIKVSEDIKVPEVSHEDIVLGIIYFLNEKVGDIKDIKIPILYAVRIYLSEDTFNQSSVGPYYSEFLTYMGVPSTTSDVNIILAANIVGRTLEHAEYNIADVQYNSITVNDGLNYSLGPALGLDPFKHDVILTAMSSVSVYFEPLDKKMDGEAIKQLFAKHAKRIEEESKLPTEEVQFMTINTVKNETNEELAAMYKNLNIPDHYQIIQISDYDDDDEDEDYEDEDDTEFYLPDISQASVGESIPVNHRQSPSIPISDKFLTSVYNIASVELNNTPLNDNPVENMMILRYILYYMQIFTPNIYPTTTMETLLTENEIAIVKYIESTSQGKYPTDLKSGLSYEEMKNESPINSESSITQTIPATSGGKRRSKNKKQYKHRSVKKHPRTRKRRVKRQHTHRVHL